MKELGAANGLNDTFVQEQQRKYIWEIWWKQDNSHSQEDMMSSDRVYRRGSWEASNTKERLHILLWYM